MLHVCQRFCLVILGRVKALESSVAALRTKFEAEVRLHQSKLEASDLTRAAVDKFRLRSKLPFGKHRQSVDDTWNDINTFFEEERHAEYLAFYVFDIKNFRWHGFTTLGKLLRKILHPKFFKLVSWSNDANVGKKDLPLVPEVLQGFVEVAIESMLDSADLPPGERPEGPVIEHHLQRVFNNARYHASRQLQAKPDDPGTSASTSRPRKRKRSRLTTLVCKSCNKRLHSVQLLQRHIKTVHPEEGPSIGDTSIVSDSSVELVIDENVKVSRVP